MRSMNMWDYLCQSIQFKHPRLQTYSSPNGPIHEYVVKFMYEH